MTSISKTVMVMAIAGGLAACGGGDQVEANQSAAAEAADAAAASGPYAQAEQRMNEAMAAAVGTDAGDSWVRKMIEHHQGAIAMSRIMLGLGPSAGVGQMAQQTIDKQTREIADLRKLVKPGAPDPQSAELYRPAEMQMHNAMLAATGADAGETFLRKMLEHHRGAVAMSDVALRSGVAGALRTQVQKTRDDQQKEIEMVEAMLRGEPMEQAMQQPAGPVEPARASPAPAEKPAAAPKPAPRPAPRPVTAEPKPAPPPAPTCAPEHRAAGHC